MAEAHRPLINPTLRLLIEPARENIEGRGKGASTIKRERLSAQRETLREDIRKLERTTKTRKNYAGKILLVAEMFVNDSLAPTHTPFDFFHRSIGCELIAPLGYGYLVEVGVSDLQRLRSRIDSEAPADQSDISRIKSVYLFSRRSVLKGRSLDSLWDRAAESDSGRYFLIWLRPFHDTAAREALLDRFARLAQATLSLPAAFDGDKDTLPAKEASQAPTARAMRQYRQTRGIGRAILSLTRKSHLARVLASGTVFRIDPVVPLHITSGTAPKKSTTPPILHDAPTVAVVDGGLKDKNYLRLQAWEVPSIVSDKDADVVHGNAVSSLIAHAHELNPHLNLPTIGCRIGTAQAVPSAKSNRLMLPDELLDMLAGIAVRHRNTRVWNLSFNVVERDEGVDEVSDLGHQIATIARATGALPVISIGNVTRSNTLILPPADCEAALTIGGRVPTKKGLPDKHCKKCCEGPGPEGMLKPELSWFSPIKVLGDADMVGSSFPTALVSVVAAHTFENLKEPTPDLVKALLINKAERESHDSKLGWGTPYDGAAPWECAPGSVTMVWQSGLEASLEYHWDGITIPEEMMDGNNLVGSAKLTAILNPLVSPFAGPNYFSTRIEVALQYRDQNNRWANLLGTLKESSLAEIEARNDLKKWQPIRHHAKSRFRRRVTGTSFRLRARLYTRDLYQPGMPRRDNLPEQQVAFVLTLRGPVNDSGIYDTVVRDLGHFVQSAVIAHDIHV